jgi:5-methylcytosine-specific restriction endonuclease McrA
MTPRKKISDKLKKITREIVRQQFHNKCAKCGKHIEGVDSQKAHIKSVGAYPHLQFDLQNMILLCYHCHIGWWHHEPTEAGAWFKKEFQDRFKYLEKAKKIRTHHSVSDLEELYEDYKKILKELS